MFVLADAAESHPSTSRGAEVCRVRYLQAVQIFGLPGSASVFPEFFQLLKFQVGATPELGVVAVHLEGEVERGGMVGTLGSLVAQMPP